MSNIIIDSSKLKVCEGFYAICDYAKLEGDFADRLWQDILTDREIYEELVYYMNHHTFEDRVKIEGYSISDLYVFQMSRYNLIRDLGKNPRECNKERMVMKAFREFLDMKKDPGEHVKRLQGSRGDDQL